MIKSSGQKVLVKNSKAFYDYFLDDFLEAGLVLTGTEIKSLRDGGGSLSDSYVILRNEEIFLLNMHIAPYKSGNLFNHEPLRTRKLLLNKKEILKYAKAVKEKGLTIVPTKIYLLRGRAKIEIALAKGKKNYDKREAIKAKDQARKLDRVNKGDFND
jgi:SsrA-binding protein